MTEKSRSDERSAMFDRMFGFTTEETFRWTDDAIWSTLAMRDDFVEPFNILRREKLLKEIDAERLEFEPRDRRPE